MAWLWHKAVWIAVASVLLAAACVLALRYWVLPNVGDYRERVAQSVSEAAGQRVTIGAMTAGWEGLHPRLNLGDVVVYDKAGRAALTLQRVDSTLSWLSVPLWSPRFVALDFYEPRLNIRRDKSGRISVGGIEMGGDSSEGGFSDWVLSQRDIEIHNAAIDWTDEMRGAPVLQLRDVRLHLVNRGERHRFGLRAVPPSAVAGPLDLRGDLTGASLKQPASWTGRVFAHLDHADIAAWRTWVPFPFEMQSGAGAVRAWAMLRNQALQELIADVRLANVRTRLGRDLPELDMQALSGRVAWKKTPKSVEFSTRQLSLTAAGKTGVLELPPMARQIHGGEQPAAGAETHGQDRCPRQRARRVDRWIKDSVPRAGAAALPKDSHPLRQARVAAAPGHDERLPHSVDLRREQRRDNGVYQQDHEIGRAHV